MPKAIIDFKINGVIKAKEFNGMSFGRQLEHWRKIQEFQATAKTNWISQKRTPRRKALKEFIDLYEVDQYYFKTFDEPGYKDDTFQIWYTTKEKETADASQ